MKNTKMIAGHKYSPLPTEQLLDLDQRQKVIHIGERGRNILNANKTFIACNHCIDLNDTTYRIQDYWFSAEVFVDLTPKEILQEIINEAGT